jgi:hypothetical protein
VTGALAGGSVGRFVDRSEDVGRRVDPDLAAGPPRPWRHPQAAAQPSSPGDRFVDHDFFDDRPDDVTATVLRRGARVRHSRFGEGQVLSVANAGEPAVVAFFPGWGERKILARFLKRA